LRGRKGQQVSVTLLAFALVVVLGVAVVNEAAYQRAVVLLAMIGGLAVIGCVLGIAWRWMPPRPPMVDVPVAMY
jgi:hypothetical protein